jgi:uncharacterized cupin superfamily protein
MASANDYTIVYRDELERTGSWSLVRRSLGCRSFGINLVEIDPGESIPEHDEMGRDQEEVFFVLDGSPVLVIDGEEHAIPQERLRAWTRAIAAPFATPARMAPPC